MKAKSEEVAVLDAKLAQAVRNVLQRCSAVPTDENAETSAETSGLP